MPDLDHHLRAVTHELEETLQAIRHDPSLADNRMRAFVSRLRKAFEQAESEGWLRGWGEGRNAEATDRMSARRLSEAIAPVADEEDTDV